MTSVPLAWVRTDVGLPSTIYDKFTSVSRTTSDLANLGGLGATIGCRTKAAYANIGRRTAAPRVRPLLLWGADDRLARSAAKDARRLHASLPGSTLRLIPDAGHFPQLEVPEAFARQLQERIES